MKSIGLVTSYFESDNIGAILSNYSLISFIESCGYCVKTISEYGPIDSFYLKNNKNISFIKDNFNLFNTNDGFVSEGYFNLSICDDIFDLYIVGPDTLWSKTYNQDGNFKYLLPNTKRPKIAYATSFGDNKFNLTDDTKIIYTILLSKFNKIFTRDIQSQKILAKDCHIDSQIIVDPIFFHEGDFYNSLCESNNSIKEQKFCFILSQSLAKLINHKNYYSEHLYLGNIINHIISSQEVITDSYHIASLCIIFKKSFYILGNESSPGFIRIKSLQMLFPELKVITNDYVNALNKNNINYISSSSIVHLIEKSKELLIKALENYHESKDCSDFAKDLSNQFIGKFNGYFS